MSHPDKRLKNYLINTLGISKTIVMEYVEERLEEIIAKHVHSKLNSGDAQEMILNHVTKLVREGIASTQRYWYERQTFEDYVKQVMRQILEQKVNEEYDLEVKMVRKDKKVIGKA